MVSVPALQKRCSHNYSERWGNYMMGRSKWPGLENKMDRISSGFQQNGLRIGRFRALLERCWQGVDRHTRALTCRVKRAVLTEGHTPAAIARPSNRTGEPHQALTIPPTHQPELGATTTGSDINPPMTLRYSLQESHLLIHARRSPACILPAGPTGQSNQEEARHERPRMFRNSIQEHRVGTATNKYRST